MSSDKKANLRGARRIGLHLFVAAAASCCGAVPVAAETILVGRAEACTVHTIQAAIDRAIGNGGDERILVTNDVDGDGYRESLSLVGQHEGTRLEIVGGLSDCVKQESTSVRTTVHAGVPGQAALVMLGWVDIRVSGLHLEGGSKGIEWQGYGDVELADVALGVNNGAGIAAIGNGGEARVLFSGNVEVSDNLGDGIFLWDAMLAIRGDGNAVARNVGSGIMVDGASSVQIGARGRVISANRGYGVVVNHSGENEAPPTLLYSIDAADPLRISGNRLGAIFQTAIGSSHRVCMRGVAMDGHGGPVLRVHGSLATLDVNGDQCLFPPEADIACAAPRELGQCNTIVANAAAGQPLVVAREGARINLQRVLIAGNSAASLLSSLQGSNEVASTIALRNAVVAGNIAEPRLIEAVNDSSVEVTDTTIRANQGNFATFAAGGAYSLAVTDSIVDQPQPLMSSSSDPSALRMTRVLARNRDGMPDGGDHDILLGTPIYLDADGHLAPGSPGVDHAPAGGGLDFDGHPRDVDLPDVPNVQGVRDLGAFETPEPPLFSDGFEAT